MEKKLTDEEIVKALVHCSSNRSCEYCYHNDEVGSGEIVCRARLMIKAIDLIHRLQDENKRLTEENGELEKTVNDMSWVIKIHKYCVGANHCQNRSDGEFELQKQVDELTEQRDNQAYIAEELVQEKHRWTEQAVKDTAKDLLIEFNEWINEHYDAKYDTYCVCIPVDKVSEFLMQKLKEYGVEVG